MNIATISIGYGSSCYTDKDLYIPKKVYNLDKKRYLTLREIAKLENQFFCNGILYEESGIKFIDNTEEEILHVAEEMFLRIKGEWKDSEEDKIIYNEYVKIMDEINNISIKNERNWAGGIIPCTISVWYLRNNLYLLE